MKYTILAIFLTALCVRADAGAFISGNDTIRIVVSANKQQQLRFGVDAERLWHWNSAQKDELAQLAVGRMKSDYVRVAINPGYEKLKGDKKIEAYDQILEMMKAMKKANPGIHFFASPRPMHESYSREEKEIRWGHRDNVPFSPYPEWIQPWIKDGTKKLKDGTIVPKWQKGPVDAPGMVQYFADYLNLMHEKGFNITYLDVTNEQTIMTPALNKYIYDQLPGKLSSGVHMPAIVVPSSWSIEGATKWLRSLDKSKNEHLAFSVAAAHNTGKGGVLEDFVKEARLLNKEVWNTELHGWTGIGKDTEIMNSAIFWKHMRAGFSGIDTWLFYGPMKGRDHTMVHSDGQAIRTSAKYEIFKEVVNNANRGFYIDVSMPDSGLITAGFIKDDVLSVWVLNNTRKDYPSVAIDLRKYPGLLSEVASVRWNKEMPETGERKGVELGKDNVLMADIKKESLYLYKFKINK